MSKFHCQQCDYVCQKKITLHKHTNTKHGDMAKNSRENISKSIKQQKSPIFYCDECEHFSKNKKGLKEHKEKNQQAQNAAYAVLVLLKKST